MWWGWCWGWWGRLRSGNRLREGERLGLPHETQSSSSRAVKSSILPVFAVFQRHLTALSSYHPVGRGFFPACGRCCTRARVPPTQYPTQSLRTHQPCRNRRVPTHSRYLSACIVFVKHRSVSQIALKDVRACHPSFSLTRTRFPRVFNTIGPGRRIRRSAAATRRRRRHRPLPPPIAAATVRSDGSSWCVARCFQTMFCCIGDRTRVSRSVVADESSRFKQTS